MSLSVLPLLRKLHSHFMEGKTEALPGGLGSPLTQRGGRPARNLQPPPPSDMGHPHPGALLTTHRSWESPCQGPFKRDWGGGLMWWLWGLHTRSLPDTRFQALRLGPLHPRAADLGGQMGTGTC